MLISFNKSVVCPQKKKKWTSSTFGSSLVTSQIAQDQLLRLRCLHVLTLLCTAHVFSWLQCHPLPAQSEKNWKLLQKPEKNTLSAKSSLKCKN